MFFEVGFYHKRRTTLRASNRAGRMRKGVGITITKAEVDVLKFQVNSPNVPPHQTSFRLETTLVPACVIPDAPGHSQTVLLDKKSESHLEVVFVRGGLSWTVNRVA